jgi:hypothetical protein
MTVVHCPSCQATMEIDENQSGEWKCQTCAATLRATKNQDGIVQLSIASPANSEAIQAQSPASGIQSHPDRPAAQTLHDESPDLDIALPASGPEHRYPGLQPGKPPPLFTLNGCGLMMYGSRDRDPETGAYVTSACLVFLFVPVFVLRSFVVFDAQSTGWIVLGRVPLSPLARGWNVIMAVVLCLMIFACLLSR